MSSSDSAPNRGRTRASTVRNANRPSGPQPVHTTQVVARTTRRTGDAQHLGSGTGVNPALSQRSSRQVVTGSTPQVAVPSSGSDQRSAVRSAPQSNKAPRGWRPGIGLQLKFTGVLSAILGVALIALGLAMWGVSSRFLLGLKLQSGVEIAKAIAQVPDLLRPQIEGKNLTPDQIRALAEKHLAAAVTWGRGNEVRRDLSDIDSISISLGSRIPGMDKLNNVYVATGVESVFIPDGRVESVFVPKLNETLTFPHEIMVTPGVRKVQGSDVLTPIYRIKVELGEQYGAPMDSNGAPSHVRIDLSATSLSKVNTNLFLIIITCVIVALALAAAVGWMMAKQITRPVRVLVRDMKAVSAGDLDHRTKPHSGDEIGLLAIEFNHMTASLKQAQESSLEREREQERGRNELQTATEVQRHLLPTQTPNLPGYECSAHYQGAKGVSGDYFDFIDLGNGQLGFIIADVSGKGVPGAMVMAVTRTTIRLVAPQHGQRVAETLKTTNRLIAKQIKRGMFVTALFALLDSRTGTVTLASAGHNPMAVYRAASGTVEFITGKGIALGFNEGPIFDRTIEERRFQMNHGDVIVLYTDGFPEAMNSANEEFSDERFSAAIARHAGMGARQVISGVVSEVAKHRGNAEQSDDLTIIAVRRQ